MNATTGADLDKILHRVQALIAKAESTQEQFPHEADSFRAKAEALMHQYRIEESMLAAAAPAGSVFMPEWRDWWVCRMDSLFRDTYRQIASWVAYHVGAEGVFRFRQRQDDNGTNWMVMEAVGYESDLRYGEMLLTACLLAFGERMEPKVDANLSEQVNAYRMRKAGMELARIARLLRGDEASRSKSQRRALRMMVLAECQERGEDPDTILGAGNNMKTYRASYGEGFSFELLARLRRMRIEAGEGSQAMILAGRADAVREAFYAKFPHFRPSDKPVEKCPNCAKAKSGHCRKHPAGPAPKARPENYQARQAGAAAASTVDLGTTGRLTN